MGRFLDEVRRAGFSGVQNFPTVGLIDGTFRVGLEETGMGYELEVEMVGDASAKLSVVLSPTAGGGGYEVIDMSGEEPWSSLK